MDQIPHGAGTARELKQALTSWTIIGNTRSERRWATVSQSKPTTGDCDAVRHDTRRYECRIPCQERAARSNGSVTTLATFLGTPESLDIR